MTRPLDGFTITPAPLQGVFEVSSPHRRDARGYLVRTYESERLQEAGIDCRWVQESLSYTHKAHTIRGLHVQPPPNAESKLITIVSGVMRWVVVDLRKGSPTFGRSHACALSAERHDGILVGAGFAHGCVSLTDHCMLVIKSDQPFVEQAGKGIVWNDATLAIDWGIGDATPILSDRDKHYPSFDTLMQSFDGF